jgi:hypothetical protein
MRFLHALLGIALVAIVSACQSSHDGLSTNFEAELPVQGNLVFR